MSNLLIGFTIGWLVRSLLHWRDNYRLNKSMGEISDGMKKHKVRMDELNKRVSDTKETIKKTIEEVKARRANKV